MGAEEEMIDIRNALEVSEWAARENFHVGRVNGALRFFVPFETHCVENTLVERRYDLCIIDPDSFTCVERAVPVLALCDGCV